MASSRDRRRGILIVTREDLFGQGMSSALKSKGYRTWVATKFRLILDRVYLDPPDLLLLDEEATREGSQDIITWMVAGDFQGRVPLIIMVDEGGLARVARMRRLPVDDYLIKPFAQEELLLKVDLCFRRGERQWERNPLTLLPGNLRIIREIQRRLDIDEPFAFAYSDLSDFKPFNDRYGFSRGDEVLHMTARIMTNTVKEICRQRGFVGHIGGDDFVFSTDADLVDEVCQQMIERFDFVLPTFYEEEDRARGFIVSLDRRGNENRFPFMSLAIGIATNETRKFSHYGEISEVASDLKNFAKKWPGSHYCRDKRLR